MTAVFDTRADANSYQVSRDDDVSETTARSSVQRARTHLEMAADEVVWQIKHRVWEHLGYGSWDEMREAEYGGVAVMVPRGDRPELVGQLRSLGMTQQSIADTIGVSQRQVSTDLNSSTSIEQPPTVTNARGQERPSSYKPKSTEAKSDPVAAEEPSAENSKPEIPDPVIPESEVPQSEESQAGDTVGEALAVEPGDVTKAEDVCGTCSGAEEVRGSNEFGDETWVPCPDCQTVGDDLEDENDDELDEQIERLNRRAAEKVEADELAEWSQEEIDLRNALERGETVVLSLRANHMHVRAFASANGRAERIDRTTRWGNPFELPADGTRDEVIQAYAEHYLPHKPSLLKLVGGLRGKALLCWCAPEPCHGDVLKARADA